MRPLLLVFGCLLLLGCAGTAEPPADGATYPDGTTQPADNVTMACEEYCPTLPHIQCVGHWEISGTYPDCVCSFECEMEETEEPAENETAEPEPSPEPTIPTTDKNTSEMLDDGIQKVRMDFYASTSNGTFQEMYYKWKRIEEDVSPGEIVFDSPTFVRIEGKTVQTLQASGFVTFENIETALMEDAYGLAIFKATETPLDDYTFFDVEYPAPIIDKRLKDCWVYEKKHQRNAQGEDLLTYYFNCMDIRD